MPTSPKLRACSLLGASSCVQANAPCSGNFKPTQRLSFLYDDASAATLTAGAGGSQGDWTLRVDDVAPNATM